MCEDGQKFLKNNEAALVKDIYTLSAWCVVLFLLLVRAGLLTSLCFFFFLSVAQ